MRRLLFILALPCLVAAEDRWIKFTSGPFEVFTDAGTRAGRETLVRLEEFRDAVGQIVGEQDLKTPEPVRVLVFKSAKVWLSTDPIIQGRDRYAIVLEEKAAISPVVYSALTRLFLDANTGRMPAAFEHGLIEFFSTFESQGVHITVGAPPTGVPYGPDLDWARIHLLVVDPQYLGRIKILLYNMRRGVDEDTCFRNAFNKPAAEVEARAKQHFAEGNFQTATLPGRPMAERDFPERSVSDADGRLARADLLEGAPSAAEYQALLRDRLKVAEAEEGLGLLALRDRRQDEARRHFAAAVEARSTSARCFIEYARLESDNEKATQALLKAAGINPQLDEPFALMAARDSDPQKRLAHWKAAAERNPRNAAYWKALAECYLADHNYSEAAKAWTQGEQAAADPTERERMRQARLAIEGQRLDYEQAEKRRQAEEEALETEKLKQEALARVRRLESKSNDGAAAPGDAPVPWFEGPKPSGKVSGTLRQVDCLGSQARLTVEAGDHKTLRLLVAEPSKVAISGRGEQTLGCGRQSPRTVSIEYFPKVNSRLGTAGEVATIEFQ